MLRIYYTCPKCGYQHPIIENWESFSPDKTLSVNHRNELSKQPCDQQILSRMDESFALDELE